MSEQMAAHRFRAIEYLKKWTPYYHKRYVVFGLITLIVFIIPWIKVNGNQLFLLSFDKKQLHLVGVVFDMQELYLLPFLLILFFLGVFFITAVAGRVFCGWGCPQTIFRSVYRDLIETKLLGIRRSLNNKQVEPDLSKTDVKMKKITGILIWSVLAVVASANLMWYFVPPDDFFAYMQNPMEHKVLLGFMAGLTGFLIYDIVSLKENFCVYVCPYARVQSVLYDDNTIMTIYDHKRGGVVYDESGKKLWKKPPEGECTGCEACVKVCPTHIDIRKGLQLECINCLECSDACAKIMANFEVPSLINWTSPHKVEVRESGRFFTFKNIAYIVALSVALVGLVFMSGTKENMLLNINRTTQLYEIKEGGIVQNNYVFLFQNTDSVDHRYSFELPDHPEIMIKRPSEPFFLKAGGKSKKVVILQTDQKLAENARKDTPVTIRVRAFAVNDKERISVERETVFVYPRSDLIKP